VSRRVRRCVPEIVRADICCGVGLIASSAGASDKRGCWMLLSDLLLHELCAISGAPLRDEGYRLRRREL
jgi:hypothetical protein